ncbi:MAG: HEPN domain-containing protein [Candidatus Bathyarchaeia archaeon]
MKSIDIALAGISRASRWLKSAERALEDQRWDDAVYSAQMCVEQSAKAILLLLGIDYPKEHDVSDVFSELAQRSDIPDWFKENVPFISKHIAVLAELRGLAGYGYEKSFGVEYFKDYAKEAFDAAKNAFFTCKKLIDQLYRIK